MTVETATYISQLDAAKPSATDPKSEGDDHLRLVKNVLKAQFPNFGAGAINATHTAINYLTGAVTADAGGNLGVGVAPSTWFDGKALQVSAIGIQETPSGAEFAYNAYRSSASVWSAIATGESSKLVLANGVFKFMAGASVSAGAAITFNDLLVVDVNRNFIQPTSSAPPSLSMNGSLVLNLTSNTNLRISARGTDGVTRTVNLTLA